MARSRTPPADPTARAQWATGITHIEPNRILVRGYCLDELMGRVNFGEAIYLLLTGELPSPSIGRLINAMLASFIDHGATPPSTLATRNVATTGASLRGSVAAGILGFGIHHGGDALACRQLLEDGLALVRTGKSMVEAAAELADRLVAANEIPPPGFGHRYHTTDPRAIRLLQIAHELEVDHEYTQLIRALEHALSRHPDLGERRLPVNVDGAIAAICADLGFAYELGNAIFLISRLPGLIAHAHEERTRQSPMRQIDPTDHAYDGAGQRRLPEGRK
jgi:citrate synthase